MNVASLNRNAAGPHGGNTPPRPTVHARYLQVLNWVFAGFNSVRIFTYLPAIWAIVESGQSGQHSLVTWACWVGANGSMALWMYETSGRRFNKAIAVSAGNALMCLATCIVISIYR